MVIDFVEGVVTLEDNCVVVLVEVSDSVGLFVFEVEVVRLFEYVVVVCKAVGCV